MLRRLDTWIMRRLDAALVWLWTRHLVAKLDVQRLTYVAANISYAARLPQADWTNWLTFVVMFIFTSVSLVMSMIEARFTVEHQNALVYARRTHGFDSFWRKFICATYPLTLVGTAITGLHWSELPGLIGLTFTVLFVFLPDAFVPTQPRKKKRASARRSLPSLKPSPVSP